MLEGTITAFKKVFYCSIWTVFNWENPLLRLIQIGDPTKYIFTLLLIVSLTIGWVVAAIVIKADKPQTDEEKFWDRFGLFFGLLLGPGCLISLIVIIFLYLQRRSVCSTHITLWCDDHKIHIEEVGDLNFATLDFKRFRQRHCWTLRIDNQFA